MNRPTTTRQQRPEARTHPRSLPRFNRKRASCGDCRPEIPVEYVAVKRDDHVKRNGLALFMQDWWCRLYAKRHLHQRIGAAYMDTPGTRRSGFRRLLAHVQACRTREVVVPRLDRLPITSARKNLFGGLAVRVVSATEPNWRGRSKADELREIRRTIDALFRQEENKKERGVRR
ncbi:hypothetical protein [Bifidobacterium tibiigranuli]|uniref:hypothetical protein n=1 Tax=Bifidobacterium tibiigranuli TaxID=2172043 RepID=UPI0026E91C1D|nr:hypothetical protein [Bifidobacterium tibiigranuli]MCI1712657.1 recombinase family protein [Bifidobacterium tibiigranuli]